jgi:hypothetical protein
VKTRLFIGFSICLAQEVCANSKTLALPPADEPTERPEGDAAW